MFYMTTPTNVTQKHLPVINAFDGREYRVGQSFPDPTVEPMQSTQVRLLDIDDKFWSAKALIQRPGEVPMWVPLTLRFTHPSYFLKRVAFIQT